MRIAKPLTSAVAVAVTLAVPATALGADYPPPSDPGGVKNPPKGGTLRVCKPKTKKPKGCFKTIQKAIDNAGKGTKVLVPNGTWKEGVHILTHKKDGVKLIGNPKDPDKVVLEGKKLKGAASQNGVMVNSADGVTIQGFHAQHYKANGFFVVNVDGYTMRNLVASQVGAYGLYAFNSLGGTMRDSEAYYNNDSGMYVGQTPVQTKPKRTILTNLVSWGNVLGYSGTNSKYVTITKSKFFNNGLGVVPNVLTSEKFAPAEENVIADNDIFWNNFNYRQAPAPFESSSASTDGVPYPIGGGLLLFGGQNTTVDSNRIWGNYLFGAGEIHQLLAEQELGDAALLKGNTFKNNVFGNNALAGNGKDLNGYDLFYAGDGTDNCFSGNQTQSPNVPANNATFVPCGSGQTAPMDNDALAQGVKFSTDPPETHWVKNPHTSIDGITPLEHWSKSYKAPEVK
jgi:hypothetical protein